MNMQTSRRALLGSMALAPIAGAAVAFPAVANATADSAAWDKALRQYKRSRAIYERSQAHYDVVYESWKAAQPSQDMIDMSAFTFERRHDVAEYMDIEARWETFVAGEGRSWFPGPNRDQVLAKHKASYDTVREYRRLCAANAERHNMDRLDRDHTAVMDALDETTSVLLQMPCPYVSALLWKLEHLFGSESRDGEGYGSAWSADLLDPVLADARRLLGGEA